LAKIHKRLANGTGLIYLMVWLCHGVIAFTLTAIRDLRVPYVFLGFPSGATYSLYGSS